MPNSLGTAGAAPHKVILKALAEGEERPEKGHCQGLFASLHLSPLSVWRTVESRGRKARVQFLVLVTNHFPFLCLYIFCQSSGKSHLEGKVGNEGSGKSSHQYANQTGKRVLSPIKLPFSPRRHKMETTPFAEKKVLIRPFKLTFPTFSYCVTREGKEKNPITES